MVTKLIKITRRARVLSRQVCVLLLMFCISCSSASNSTEFGVPSSEIVHSSEYGVLSTMNSEPNQNKLDSILDNLNKNTQELKSYQCEIEYKYVQPSVFGAQTIRRGMLYYSKNTETWPGHPKGRMQNTVETHGLASLQTGFSKLRVNFQTLRQDEDEEQKYNEQYIIVDGASISDSGGKYKGLWLVQLDYELKNCKYIQLTQADPSNDEPNKPVDVFELISTKLPIVGFSKTNRLKEEFEISAAPRDANDGLIQVQFKVKPNSVYKDDYVQIDCVIDEKQNLPVKITAISTEPEGEALENKDLYEIKFINAKINQNIDDKVFDFEIPKDFGKTDVYPLEN